MTPNELFRHILAMAAADGRMNESELRLLAARAAELGVSDVEFETALSEAASGNARLTIPEDVQERRALLKDLIRMMAADGRLDPREKELFATVAAMMDLSNDDLHAVIDAALAEG
jgi:uncharacterized tellurite resistance protein B-like protein